MKGSREVKEELLVHEKERVYKLLARLKHL